MGRDLERASEGDEAREHTCSSRIDGCTCDTTPVLGLARVRGRSMEPGLHDGDLLLVRYAVTPVPGRVVVARFADGTVAVKRAVERRDRGWWLLSDNAAEGVDSRHRGAVPEADVLAVVVLRLGLPWLGWPRVRRLRR
ncbi:MAG: S24/S26 family peptidase [Nocardioides sp.]|uniref:S24/S26 family peptidase n=1 Tax=Nocardioides sp. TaxID=35761 RepID=UPI0039E4FC45